MKGKAKAGVAGLVLGIVGLALVGVPILEAQVQPPNAGGAAQPGPYPLGAEQRIQAQVAEAGAETLAESIENLVEPDMYFRPGLARERVWAGSLPLAPEDGGDDVDTILGNRRFVRVYEEFAALSAEDATALLVAAFPRFVKSYREALDGYLGRARRGWRLPPGARGGAPSFQIGGPPSGRLNPLGERYRLLALVLIASNLQLEGAHAAVQDVVKQGLADRELLYAEGEFNKAFRHGMLVMGTVYNRQILAHALLATSPDKAPVAQVWAALGKEMQTKDVPVFDAARTEADTRFLPWPVDFSKGVMTVEYLPSLSDQEFNLVVEALMPKEKPTGP